MDLPVKVRAKIIKDFNLERTGQAGIQNGKIISDGYVQKDISKINLLNLQKVLDSADEDFDTMFADYVDMIQKALTVIEEPEILIDTTQLTPVIADFNSIEEYIPNTVVEEVFNPNIAQSGDTETYFGTKIKPVTYKQNGKKTK